MPLTSNQIFLLVISVAITSQIFVCVTFESNSTFTQVTIKSVQAKIGRKSFQKNSILTTYPSKMAIAILNGCRNDFPFSGLEKVASDVDEEAPSYSYLMIIRRSKMKKTSK